MHIITKMFDTNIDFKRIRRCINQTSLPDDIKR